MAIVTIGFTNKSDVNTSSTPAINKVSAADINEIKSVVNTNANLQGDLENLNTIEKSTLVGSINELKTYFPVELYSQNDSARYSTYTLNDSISNYTFIEVIGKFYTGASVSIKIPTSQTSFCISGYDFNASTETASNIYFHIQAFNMTGDTISFKKAAWGRESSYSTGDSSLFIIYKILGYK